jgi:hypothetical protein
VKVASFSVRATAEQSVRWKSAAAADGHLSVGTWLAEAADAYLKVRARAGRPIPLAWRRGRFSVRLEGGELVTVKGHVSPPFGAYAGSTAGPALGPGRRRFTLVHVPYARIVATLKTFAQCRALASELAPILLRGELPNPSPIVERHVREAL